MLVRSCSTTPCSSRSEYALSNVGTDSSLFLLRGFTVLFVSLSLIHWLVLTIIVEPRHVAGFRWLEHQKFCSRGHSFWSWRSRSFQSVHISHHMQLQGQVDVHAVWRLCAHHSTNMPTCHHAKTCHKHAKGSCHCLFKENNSTCKAKGKRGHTKENQFSTTSRANKNAAPLSGEGVVSSHSVTATGLVWRHGVEFGTLKVC